MQFLAAALVRGNRNLPMYSRIDRGELYSLNSPHAGLALRLDARGRGRRALAGGMAMAMGMTLAGGIPGSPFWLMSAMVVLAATAGILSLWSP